jgi:hypothetical protein
MLTVASSQGFLPSVVPLARGFRSRSPSTVNHDGGCWSRARRTRQVPQLTAIDKTKIDRFSLALAAMIDSSTEFARERSREAADRTLMACIRTALALIGFGVGKFYPQHAELRGQQT